MGVHRDKDTFILKHLAGPIYHKFSSLKGVQNQRGKCQTSSGLTPYIGFLCDISQECVLTEFLIMIFIPMTAPSGRKVITTLPALLKGSFYFAQNNFGSSKEYALPWGVAAVM